MTSSQRYITSLCLLVFFLSFFSFSFLLVFFVLFFLFVFCLSFLLLLSFCCLFWGLCLSFSFSLFIRKYPDHRGMDSATVKLPAKQITSLSLARVGFTLFMVFHNCLLFCVYFALMANLMTI